MTHRSFCCGVGCGMLRRRLISRKVVMRWRGVSVMSRLGSCSRRSRTRCSGPRWGSPPGWASGASDAPPGPGTDTAKHTVYTLGAVHISDISCGMLCTHRPLRTTLHACSSLGLTRFSRWPSRATHAAFGTNHQASRTDQSCKGRCHMPCLCPCSLLYFHAVIS